MKQRTWSDEDLIEAVKTCNSITKIVDKLQLVRSGRNFDRIKQVAKKIGLELPTKKNTKKIHNCIDCNIMVARKIKRCNTCHQKYLNRNKGQVLICIECNKEYIYDSNKNHTLEKCSNCSVNKKRKKDFKQKCVDLKGGKCIICQYDKCLTALCFHHVDPKEKEFILSVGYRFSEDKIKKELDKCVLLCNNCHSEVHEGVTQLPNL